MPLFVVGTQCWKRLHVCSREKGLEFPNNVTLPPGLKKPRAARRSNPLQRRSPRRNSNCAETDFPASLPSLLRTSAFVTSRFCTTPLRVWLVRGDVTTTWHSCSPPQHPSARPGTSPPATGHTRPLATMHQGGGTADASPSPCLYQIDRSTDRPIEHPPQRPAPQKSHACRSSPVTAACPGEPLRPREASVPSPATPQPSR